MNRFSAFLPLAALLAPCAARAQDPYVLIMQADSAAQAHRFSDARRLYEQVYAVTGFDPSALVAAGENAALAREDSVALAVIGRAISAGFVSDPFIAYLEQNMAYAALRTTPQWRILLDDARERLAAINTALRAELLSIAERDQANREGIGQLVAQYGRHSRQADSAFRALAESDAPLLERVRAIIEEHGWPGRRLVGDDGAHAAWLVVQHAPARVQRELLPILREAVAGGEARASDLALLEDRVLVADGKPQIYGSQTQWPDSAGASTLAPIADEACVDRRRASVGLEPLAVYLRRLGVEYTGPPDSCTTPR